MGMLEIPCWILDLSSVAVSAQEDILSPRFPHGLNTLLFLHTEVG